MKKIILLLWACIFSVQFAGAQPEKIHIAKEVPGNKKIYVYREGGKKKLLTFGRMGYDVYYFNNTSGQCDTLICKGSGFELCKVDREIIRLNKEEESKYLAFNSAIHEAEKRIRKSGCKAGIFEISDKGQKISVSFQNANKKGEGEMGITLL